MAIEIVVNVRKETVETPSLSYEDVVRLAFGPGHEGRIFTITYRSARAGDIRRGGELTPGQSITVDAGMIFNVAYTNKA